METGAATATGTGSVFRPPPPAPPPGWAPFAAATAHTRHRTCAGHLRRTVARRHNRLRHSGHAPPPKPFDRQPTEYGSSAGQPASPPASPSTGRQTRAGALASSTHQQSASCLSSLHGLHLECVLGGPHHPPQPRQPPSNAASEVNSLPAAAFSPCATLSPSATSCLSARPSDLSRGSPHQLA